jgi:hypothetical protein
MAAGECGETGLKTGRTRTVNTVVRNVVIAGSDRRANGDDYDDDDENGDEFHREVLSEKKRLTDQRMS